MNDMVVSKLKLIIGQRLGQHLAFQERLTFVPTSLLLPHLEYDDLDLEILDLEEKVKRNFSKYVEAIDSEQPGFSKTLSTHLEEAYQNAVKPWLQELDRHNDAHKEFFRRVRRFKRTVRRIRCDRCGSSANHICDGKNPIRDDALVSNGGECWKILNDLFMVLMDAVDQSYYEKVKFYRVAPEVEIVFVTQPTNKNHISAVTHLEDDASTHNCRSVLVFGLPPSKADESEFFVLPYKILHELAVHAVQAILWDRASSGQRPIYGESCGFTEGLVDGAAYDILEKRLSNEQNWPEELQIFLKQFLRMAKIHHCQRQTHLRSDLSSRARHARSIGYNVFHSLCKMFGKEDVISRILAANIQPLSVDQRADFIRRLYPITKKSKQQLKPADWDAINELFVLQDAKT